VFSFEHSTGDLLLVSLVGPMIRPATDYNQMASPRPRTVSSKRLDDEITVAAASCA